MKRKALALALVIVIALVLAAVVYGVQITRNSNPPSNPKPSPSLPRTSPAISIYVTDNYSTIQQAIDSASPGSAIYVRSGDYNVSVTVNKAVWLIGENRQAKIDAHSVGPDLLICHSDVNITGFDLARACF
jgi:pectin methylesterase-like acyl-CoA thioesterase